MRFRKWLTGRFGPKIAKSPAENVLDARLLEEGSPPYAEAESTECIERTEHSESTEKDSSPLIPIPIKPAGPVDVIFQIPDLVRSIASYLTSDEVRSAEKLNKLKERMRTNDRNEETDPILEIDPILRWLTLTMQEFNPALKVPCPNKINEHLLNFLLASKTVFAQALCITRLTTGAEGRLIPEEVAPFFKLLLGFQYNSRLKQIYTKPSNAPCFLPGVNVVKSGVTVDAKNLPELLTTPLKDESAYDDLCKDVEHKTLPAYLPFLQCVKLFQSNLKWSGIILSLFIANIVVLRYYSIPGLFGMQLDTELFVGCDSGAIQALNTLGVSEDDCHAASGGYDESSAIAPILSKHCQFSNITCGDVLATLGENTSHIFDGLLNSVDSIVSVCVDACRGIPSSRPCFYKAKEGSQDFFAICNISDINAMLELYSFFFSIIALILCVVYAAIVLSSFCSPPSSGEWVIFGRSKKSHAPPATITTGPRLFSQQPMEVIMTRSAETQTDDTNSGLSAAQEAVSPRREVRREVGM